MFWGSVWDRFGMVLGSFWDGLGIVLGSFWDGFRIVFGSAQDCLRSVRAMSGHALRMFWYGFSIVLICLCCLLPIFPVWCTAQTTTPNY